MDILSHGLWGGIAFGRKPRRFWLAFSFGILPDLVAFGPFFIGVVLGLYHPVPVPLGAHPEAREIPELVHSLYNITHSLAVFAVVFLLLWWWKKKIIPEIFAWPLHILFDIFTHTKEFFPTPFLWPIAKTEVSISNWTDPHIFIPNVLLLAGLYGWLYLMPWLRGKEK